KTRVSLSFIPTDARHRMPRIKHTFIEHSLHAPVAMLLRPVERRVPILFLSPLPTLIAPPLAPRVSTFRDKLRILFVGRQQFIYSESRNMNRVRRPFVVVSERVPRRSHHERAFGNTRHLTRR